MLPHNISGETGEQRDETSVVRRIINCLKWRWEHVVLMERVNWGEVTGGILNISCGMTAVNTASTMLLLNVESFLSKWPEAQSWKTSSVPGRSEYHPWGNDLQTTSWLRDQCKHLLRSLMLCGALVILSDGFSAQLCLKQIGSKWDKCGKQVQRLVKIQETSWQ